MLSTLKKDDEIFSKNYMASPRKHKKPELKSIVITKDLLAGLPLKPPNSKQPKRIRLKLFKEARMKQKEDRKKDLLDSIILEY